MFWTRRQKQRFRRLSRRLARSRPRAPLFWFWSRRVSIYVLIDEKTVEIKYVGRSVNLDRRMRSHRRNGRDYLMLEIDAVPSHLAAKREQYWIDKIRSWGYSLLNKIDAKDRS